jgi:transcriptional antiterminator/mannitol/fructose-specific phosphotransferase system IIA component (Ntr-type)
MQGINLDRKPYSRYNEKKKEYRMKERQIELLMKLINSTQPITYQELADYFHVSRRTVRYDIETIDVFLSANDFSVLEKRPNRGVFLNQATNRLELTNKIEIKKVSHEYVCSAYERKKRIALELLMGNGFIRISELEKMVDVSRSTVKNDLKLVRNWLSQADITVESIANHGIRITGEENKIRFAIVQLLYNYFNQDDIYGSSAKIILRKEELLKDEFVKRIISKRELDVIEQNLRTAEDALDIVFTDTAFVTIIVYMVIAIYRMKMMKFITYPANGLRRITRTTEFTVALNVVNRLDKFFGIGITNDEVAALTDYILQANYSTNNLVLDKNYVELQMMVQMMINKIAIETDSRIEEDQLLFDGLIKHLKPAIYRLENDMQYLNPLKDEIKERYQQLFYQVKETLKQVEEYVKTIFCDDEIAYFTLHFAAALERLSNQNSEPKKILLVCGTGNGSVHLLSSRLQSEFSIELIGSVAYHQIKKAVRENVVDLIVSTVPLDRRIMGVDTVTVSPLLNAKDQKNLQKYLPKNGITMQVAHQEESLDMILRKEVFLEEMIMLIKRDTHVFDEENLKHSIEGLMNRWTTEPEQRTKNIGLMDILNERLVEIDVEVEDWKEAVQIAGNKLLDEGCIKQRYIDHMIEAVEEIGPYIVIYEGIAMPHARIQDGVNKLGISFVRLLNPVCFGNPDNDPVDLIFALCTIDKSSHIQAVTELGALCTDENVLKQLRAEENVEEILEIIRKKVGPHGRDCHIEFEEI